MDRRIAAWWNPEAVGTVACCTSLHAFAGPTDTQGKPLPPKKVDASPSTFFKPMPSWASAVRHPSPRRCLALQEQVTSFDGNTPNHPHFRVKLSSFLVFHMAMQI